MIKGNNFCFTDHVKKKFGIHSDIDELILPKLGLTMHTIDLYISILVLMILTNIQVHRVGREKTSLCHLSDKFTISVLLRLVGVLNLILFHPKYIQRTMLPRWFHILKI